jgi:hypothetical protein
MKLIRALSEKNKLARNIKDIQNRITSHNSYIAGNSPVYNIQKQLDDLDENIDKIVEIKSKIAAANLERIQSIYRLSELKSQASFLKKLKIKEGKVKEEGYNSDVNEYKSELPNVARDKLVENLEAKIDLLQMEMDKFNFEKDI